MFGFLRPKPLLDEATAAWLQAAFAWALRSFDATLFRDHIRLVEPTDEFFPDRIEDSRQLATTLFARVKSLAGMQDWPCELVVQAPDLDPIIQRTVVLRGMPQSPAGTLRRPAADGEPATVTYNPKLVKEPARFIATMAHELAHFFYTIREEDPPGGANTTSTRPTCSRSSSASASSSSAARSRFASTRTTAAVPRAGQRAASVT